MELQGYESYKMMKNFGLPIEPLTKVQKIGFNRVSSLITSHKYEMVIVSKKVCKLNIILIFVLSNKKQQEYGTYTRTNFGNYFELHK